MAIVRNHKPTRYRKIADDSFTNRTVEKLENDLAKIQKKGFDHFMLKEIFEQPSAVTDTLRGRLRLKEGIIKMAIFSILIHMLFDIFLSKILHIFFYKINKKIISYHLSPL